MIHLCNLYTIRISLIQARKKELMGKVNQAEQHVDMLQKEALGNLQLRMDEVGRFVTDIPVHNVHLNNGVPE